MEVEIKLPPKLVPVFSRPSRYKAAHGGRGSGKTRSFAKMFAVKGYIAGKSGRSGILLCCREFMNSLRDSSFGELKHAIREEPWLAEYYDVGESYIRSRDGAIEFSFMGLKRNVDSIKSMARILAAWVDEAETVSELSWQKLIPTVREDDSEIWISWNPESKQSATHKRFRANPPKDAIIVEMNWRDNPWFPEVLEAERLEDLDKRPDSYGWIWEGEFRTAFEGAYYSAEMRAAKTEGRIGNVKAEPSLAAYAAWDLGIGDSTAIWVMQPAPGGVRVLDYIEDHGKPLAYYVAKLEQAAQAGKYEIDTDYLPHDARVRELGTGRTRVETLEMMGRRCRVIPLASLEDGINAVREVLPRCWFSDRTERGQDALREYRTEYVEDAQTFKERPLHNWASHGADAFRYGCLAYRALTVKKPKDARQPKPGQVMLPPPPKPRDSKRIRL